MSPEFLINQLLVQCYLGFWIGLVGTFFTYNLIKFLLAFELMTVNIIGMYLLYAPQYSSEMLFGLLSLSAVETVFILGLFVSNFGNSNDLDRMTGVSG